MGKPVEKKRKKKGRPSLLDLQKRSLRLQKQQEEQQQEKRARTLVRILTTEPDGDAEDGEDDEEEGGGKRREKKLKLVLRLHQNNGIISKSDNAQEGHSDSESSGPESKGDGDTRARRRRSMPSLLDPGLTTPLPDRKLLIFILDRLQKKDTYGVFSEPVDPTELPDYHDVITHPMDFGTVRKRLSSGYYSNLEMFEVRVNSVIAVMLIACDSIDMHTSKCRICKDVFLICTNAMSYNAPDTIYFRQARSIHELAKKDFENLRQDSDEDEPEPESSAKKTVGRPPNDRASLDFSPDATLANAGDNLPWSNSSHDNHRLVNGEVPAWMGDKGIPMRFGKKVAVLDENRRHTYKQPQLSKGWHESSVLATLDGEKKQLVPVGFHGEHAYARSLARYAATLGPAGWEIAARQIEKRRLDLHLPSRGDPLQQHSTASPLVINGFSAALSSSSSQFGRMLRPAAAPLTHAGALEMVSRGADSSVNYAAKGSQPEPGDGAATGDPRGSWRGLSLRSTPESAPPPDLNIRFQSPSSPPAAAGVADSQQPDLASSVRRPCFLSPPPIFQLEAVAANDKAVRASCVRNGPKGKGSSAEFSLSFSLLGASHGEIGR
ncbi:unnamed protein product [Spirodela intermedia]|uniref:Bromo domain-containing protein n=1 Tax=Spirodela intermedia TaxID=51605 RepID=A0A7I8IDX3_SPIIN|nr:unnamed protein product [Spirodela intermedia]CAA6655859.1 unnamed protein product [Spirodela intermedia]